MKVAYRKATSGKQFGKLHPLIKSINLRIDRHKNINQSTSEEGGSSTANGLQKKNATLPVDDLSPKVNTNFLEIRLKRRLRDGSRWAKKLREVGYLPTVVFGLTNGGDGALADKKDNMLASIRKRDVEAMMRQSRGVDSIENTFFKVIIENKPVELELGDYGRQAIDATALETLETQTSEIEVIASGSEFYCDPVTDAPMGVNFLKFQPGRKLKFPLEFFNAEGCPGLKRGGYINYIHRRITCRITDEFVPSSLVVNLTDLSVGERIRVSDLKIPPGIVPILDPHTIICTIGGKGNLKSVEEEEEDAAEPKK